jgi:hypothetical protein
MEMSRNLGRLCEVFGTEEPVAEEAVAVVTLANLWRGSDEGRAKKPRPSCKIGPP